MDHASISQDQEDLRRYRAGLPPLVRKEITLGPEAVRTPKQVVSETFKILTKMLKNDKVP